MQFYGKIVAGSDYMTVNGYLDNMQNNLYVNGVEREKIRKSINAISDRLDSYFDNSERCIHKIIEKDIFGSYSRDTMLSRNYDENSDIDYMIIFEDAKNYNPQTCLKWLRGFAECWYSTSIVKKSSPTIVIELQNIKFELVPAYKDSYGNLYIPKDDSTWQKTNVKDLNDKMLAINNKLFYSFKGMIRIIKYWNIKKNLRKYKSYQLETYLTEKFEFYSCKDNSLLSMLDWCFFYLSTYDYIDEYVHDRIKRAADLIGEAKYYDNIGNSEKAIECIKKILPEI